ncbi:hypothetical protein [Fulvimonas yonginensis]|uniref:Tetratricopeptide repeat protein n=1 Tax=Fulvimonas yonginensis TaxID=1495200 RepID=A0ABU8J9U5_9GAMM
MKRRLLGLALALALPAVHAQTGAADIRAGRAALAAEQPVQARARFAAALADPGLGREDRCAAQLGLGQATLWLGDYRAAAEAYRAALAQAPDEASRQVAATGLAQALNAQDRPREALALVAPFAAGQLRPTVEVLRSLRSLDQAPRGRPYLDAAPPAPAGGYLGTQFRLLSDDMAYALAPHIDATFDASHDSEGLDTWHVGVGALSAPATRGSASLAWGARADTLEVDDGRRSRRVYGASVLGQWHADTQRLDLVLGSGRAGDWHFLQGSAAWTVQPSDDFGLSAGVERAPVPTPTSLAQRLIGNRYALDLSLRASTHWYVLPGAYRQVFSDGNHRDGGGLRLLFSPLDVADTRGALGAELSTRLFHDSRPSRGVYFNPARYRATQAGLIGVYGLDPGWKLRANADVGRQWIDGNGASTYTVGLSLEGRLPGNGRLRLGVGRSSVASVSGGGAGYWNDNASLSLSWTL